MKRVLVTSTRTTVSWLVVIAAMATTTLALATPAHAATITVVATCSSGQIVVSNDNFAASPGDVIALGNNVGSTIGLANGSGVTFAATSVNNGNQTNISVTATSGSFDITSVGCATGRTVTFGPGTSGSPPSLPPSILQQFGKPSSGTCVEAVPVTLNWGGVGNGGWGESWAQWMNGGNGGAVCTRMLVYSSSRGAWTVG